ncbi:MAG: zinc transporter ZupT [Deltaproteobacteria bacterium]|nr:zinc transporter ZupT [Deltaproteobacteria bacterium]
MDGQVLMAFGLTLAAGLATGIGSAMAFFAKKTSTRFLSGSLGFSAGVMIYVSFVEILPKARDSLAGVYGDKGGSWAAVGGFFAGMLLIAIIDRLIPAHENPHEARCVEAICEEERKKQKLMRMGLLAALAIGIHNFPEGIATFMAALSEPAIGFSIAAAIAIHNIPEGIAVSVPIYYATGSRKKAFWFSFLSGLSEPIGALLGYFLLRTFLTPALFGFVFAGVGGIMVFISLDELFPAAREYGEGHLAIYGMVAGMMVMAASLLLFL